MTMHIRSLLIAALTFAGTAHAQMLWQDTKFGMSVAEVRSLVPSAIPASGNIATILDGSVELLRVPKLDLLDKPFVASFFFTDGQLKQVSLSLHNTPRSAAEDTFRSLLPLLREKYGQEQREDQPTKSGTEVLTAKWTRDRTEISLVLWNFGSQPSDLYIAYRGMSRRGAEKL